MKAIIKTKSAAIKAFTQYQVKMDGELVKSFYDRKEAVILRNKINK